MKNEGKAGRQNRNRLNRITHRNLGYGERIREMCPHPALPLCRLLPLLLGDVLPPSASGSRAPASPGRSHTSQGQPAPPWPMPCAAGSVPLHLPRHPSMPWCVPQASKTSREHGSKRRYSEIPTCQNSPKQSKTNHQRHKKVFERPPPWQGECSSTLDLCSPGSDNVDIRGPKWTKLVNQTYPKPRRERSGPGIWWPNEDHNRPKHRSSSLLRPPEVGQSETDANILHL